MGKFLFIEEPLILSYCIPGSISTNTLARMQAFERIYEKNKDNIQRDKRLHASWMARIGDAQMRSGSPSGGLKNLMKSVKLNPWNKRYMAKMIFSIFNNRILYVNINRIFEKEW
jgi:hypothetical protein